MSKNFKKLLILLLFLNIVDTLTTFIGLSLGLRELNPLLNFNNLNILVLKVFLPILLTVLMSISWNFALKHNLCQVKRFFYYLLFSLNIFYIVIVINNLVVLMFAG